MYPSGNFYNHGRLYFYCTPRIDRDKQIDDIQANARRRNTSAYQAIRFTMTGSIAYVAQQLEREI